MRLNKYLAHCGVCSRRDADRLIEKGEVLVNGRQAQAGMTVDDGDEILVSGRPVRGVQEPVVLAFYKPFGVVCTEKDVHAESIVSDLVDYPVRVTYAGRLDKDSEGLLLLSNDGDLIQAMMKGANCHEKEYVVRVNREITPDFLEKMSGGVYLEELDITTRKCQVEQMGRFVFRMVLTQGVNRQIKRMCIACGCRVRELKRVRVMHVTLGGLKPGEYRELDREDMERLYRDCGLAAPAGADGLS
ncbi:MAG: pseudouridine synthase [Lachnospiraceae bacterium]|nr:pseudouridine synthase [uncultured Acetatifactor sp.]MCI8789492.1 pseudouridine synthase [Lachnospiraceae bacterium]